MQNSTTPFEMGGWTYVLSAILVSIIVLIAVYLRGKVKERRLVAEGRIEIVDPAAVLRQGDGGDEALGPGAA